MLQNTFVLFCICSLIWKSSAIFIWKFPDQNNVVSIANFIILLFQNYCASVIHTILPFLRKTISHLIRHCKDKKILKMCFKIIDEKVQKLGLVKIMRL